MNLILKVIAMYALIYLIGGICLAIHLNSQKKDDDDDDFPKRPLLIPTIETLIKWARGEI